MVLAAEHAALTGALFVTDHTPLRPFDIEHLRLCAGQETFCRKQKPTGCIMLLEDAAICAGLTNCSGMLALAIELDTALPSSVVEKNSV